MRIKGLWGKAFQRLLSYPLGYIYRSCLGRNEDTKRALNHRQARQRLYEELCMG